MTAEPVNAAPQELLVEHICAIEWTRVRALLARDMVALSHLHAPDYQLITPVGQTYSRDRYLQAIESGGLRYLRWEPGTMAARVSERMAIVRYQATLELDAGGGHGTPFLCWHTDSYELAAGHWQALWSKATAIR
jgi:hypothetical protein